MSECAYVKSKIMLFLKHWLGFASYVLMCSLVVMYLESDAQLKREANRLSSWNETRDKLINLVKKASVLTHQETNDEQENLLDLLTLKDLIEGIDLIFERYLCLV